MRRPLAATLLAALLALPAAAGMPPTRTQTLLIDRPSRESLRASLLDYADSARTTNPLGAGEALYFAGMSFDRATKRDSAILCYLGASLLRGNHEERLALTDALLIRSGTGDVEAARALLDSALAQASREADPMAEAYAARLAWAEFLSGRTAAALARFGPLEASLSSQRLWRYRMARTELEAGDPRKAIRLAEPLAVVSRTAEGEVMALLARAAEAIGGKVTLEEMIAKGISERDRAEGELARSLGGRRVRFTATDEFALGGLALAPPGSSRRRAAIVLCAPGDTLVSYDSLAVGLRRAGWAVLLVDMRGSGASVGPTCPLPETWAGREDALVTRCAKDVRDGLRALSLTTAVDTSRYVVVGVGPSAMIALEAAALDRRVQALALLSPAPAPVDRGLMRARVHRLMRPIYFSQAPEDYPQFELIDALYQAGDRPVSRVGDVRGGGHGARPFRDDPATIRRLTEWLEGRLPARARSAAPRRAPRPG